MHPETTAFIRQFATRYYHPRWRFEAVRVLPPAEHLPDASDAWRDAKLARTQAYRVKLEQRSGYVVIWGNRIQGGLTLYDDEGQRVAAEGWSR